MDAFESIVATLLQDDGLWVRTSVRVKLPPEEKLRRCAARTEIDVVAYHPHDNELWVVECKSFLNSRGVKMNAFLRSKPNSRFKLFVYDEYWEAVKRKLLKDLKFSSSKANALPRVCLCLAAGRIASGDEERLREHFESNESKGWKLLGPDWFVPRLEALAKMPYRNDVATMAVKLLRCRLRDA